MYFSFLVNKRWLFVFLLNRRYADIEGVLIKSKDENFFFVYKRTFMRQFVCWKANSRSFDLLLSEISTNHTTAQQLELQRCFVICWNVISIALTFLEAVVRMHARFINALIKLVVLDWYSYKGQVISKAIFLETP